MYIYIHIYYKIHIYIIILYIYKLKLIHDTQSAQNKKSCSVIHILSSHVVTKPLW